MRKIILLIVIIPLVFSCKKQNVYVLLFDYKQSEEFIGLMDYLENKTKYNSINEKLTAEIIAQNNNDAILNRKIDSLLSLPIYDKFADKVVVYTDSIQCKGKDAYRTAFLYLPIKQVEISGDMAYQWSEYWKNNNDSLAVDFIAKFKSIEQLVSNDVLSQCSNFLPSDLKASSSVNILFCMDGNKGSFASGNNIIIDLMGMTEFNTSHFKTIIAHELHHIQYTQWFSDKLDNEKFSDKQHGLLKLQNRIIYEGTAQQLNYCDYSQQVKSLYNNRNLIKELYSEWIHQMRTIANSDTPIQTYNVLRNKMWDDSMRKLKKYCKDSIETQTIPHRPTIDYYISYHLYHSIHEKGGKERLDYVIKNYDCLLEEYNKLYTDDLLVPKIPDDILIQWKRNFIKNNT